jgi:hypothetical protein
VLRRAARERKPQTDMAKARRQWEGFVISKEAKLNTETPPKSLHKKKVQTNGKSPRASAHMTVSELSIPFYYREGALHAKQNKSFCQILAAFGSNF